MSPEFLEGKVDANGTTFQEAATAVGYGGSSHKASQQTRTTIASREDTSPSPSSVIR